MNKLQSNKKFAFSLLIILTLILILCYLYVLNQNNNIFTIMNNDKLMSVILGLFTSTLASLAIFLITIKYIQPDEINTIINNFDFIIKNNEIEYPSNIYLGSNEPNNEFNASLNMDLKETELFFFQGRSGKYIPLRLLNINELKPKSMIRLVVNNPFNYKIRSVTDTHINGYTKKPENNYLDHNFYVMLFGFFKCYSLVQDIEISLSNTPIFHRVELCSNNVYLQTFLNRDMRKNEFPTIYKYSNKSFIFSHEFGNYKIKQYRYLYGNEKIIKSSFTTLFIKTLQDRESTIINGIKIELHSFPDNDMEIIDVLNEVSRLISDKDIESSKILDLFKKLKKDI